MDVSPVGAFLFGINHFGLSKQNRSMKILGILKKVNLLLFVARNTTTVLSERNRHL
jgi:hypothetical protein